MRTIEFRSLIEKETDCEFHVRDMKNGWFWVSPDRPLRTHFHDLQRVIYRLGFYFETNGKPGTAGQDIIEVYVP